jgi:hypothetical protein
VHDAYERNLGPNHPHTLACVNNLAAVARAQNDKKLAVDRSRAAFLALRDKLGEDHPHTLAAQTNLAISSAESDDLVTAANEIRDAAERTGRVLGSDHPDALRARANEILIKRASGDADSSVGLETASELLTRTLGDNHPALTALGQGRYLHRTVDPHPF